MKTLAVGDAVARFLLTYILPKRYGDRIRRNIEPRTITILATGEINRDSPRMTLIEGVFATLLFDLALFGTDNIFINGIIRIFTKIQNCWNKSFPSEMEATKQIQQFCVALSIQTKPWIWEKPIEQYGSLNDFFSRRYAPKFMPPLNKVEVVTPACCTMQMYESDGDMRRVLIKGCEYSLERIGLPDLSSTSNNSSDLMQYGRNRVFLGYLSPTDYHRVHSPIEGTCVHCSLEGPQSLSASVKFFGGRFNILNENTRLIVVIEKELRSGIKTRLGLVIVGGVGVNTIIFDPDMKGKPIKKGGEIATFRAGGSAFAMFTTYPVDLTKQYASVAKGSAEVKVLVGEGIGNF